MTSRDVRTVAGSGQLFRFGHADGPGRAGRSREAVLGAIVAGDAPSYRYLVESIRRFPDQKSFARLIEGAGFERVQYRNLTGGIAAIHSGWRI